MQVSVAVGEMNQVGEARRNVLRLAQAVGLSDSRRSDAAIVASELSTNLARHATGGQLLIQFIDSAGAGYLEMVAVDRGPGIADLQRCLQDGYSTGGTAGTGFGAIRRLSDEFDAFSTVGKGTVVVSRLRVSDAPPLGRFQVGASCLPAPYESVCGDAWKVIAEERRVAIMIADGLGHGPGAAEASTLAADVFARHPFANDADFYRDAHGQLGRSRGAAIARAVVASPNDVQYAGVGNIAGFLIGLEGSRGMASQNGTVGAEMRRSILTQTYAWPPRGVLLMHSDGINTRWSLNDYPGLLFRHPATIATVLARDFTRGRDDATAVVVRMLQGVNAS